MNKKERARLEQYQKVVIAAIILVFFILMFLGYYLDDDKTWKSQPGVALPEHPFGPAMQTNIVIDGGVHHITSEVIVVEPDPLTLDITRPMPDMTLVDDRKKE